MVVKIRRDMSMRFTPLSGKNGVGGHSLFFTVCGVRILVDPGICHNGGGKKLRVDDLAGINCIILTHAHLDHFGSLAEVMRAYPSVKVYATPATKEIVSHWLRVREDFRRVEIEKYIERIGVLDYEVEHDLGRGVYFKFIPAGHILGSASVVITSPAGNLLVTGDFAVENRGVLKPFVAPDLDLRALISEGSYVGMRGVCPAGEDRQMFLDVLKRTTGAGQNVVVAADLFDVFHEYALLMPIWQKDGQLPSFQLFINNWFRFSFGPYLDFFPAFGLPAVEGKEPGDHYLLLDPLTEGGVSRGVGPFCYFLGPASFKDPALPRLFVRDLLCRGGALVTGNRISKGNVLKRIGKRKKNVANEERVFQGHFGNHILHDDLRALLVDRRVPTSVLIHGAESKLRLLASRLCHHEHLNVVVPVVGEEIIL